MCGLQLLDILIMQLILSVTFSADAVSVMTLEKLGRNILFDLIDGTFSIYMKVYYHRVVLL